MLTTMRHSAFPYEGMVPDTGLPFLDTTQDGQIGRMTTRGGFYSAQPTYSDRRSLLHVGAAYRGSPRSLVVVFFHGNGATLTRDVIARQRVAEQFDASGIDGVLIAPQLAFDAWDSSAGHFWGSRFLARYLNEAFSHLAPMSGAPPTALRRSRVVLVAYSGGYLPLSYCLAEGGLGTRLAGVVLLDALYGEQARFEGREFGGIGAGGFDVTVESLERGLAAGETEGGKRRIGGGRREHKSGADQQSDVKREKEARHGGSFLGVRGRSRRGGGGRGGGRPSGRR
jgi:hypothetical protein